MIRELRFCPTSELRMVADDGQPPKVTGYASVFNSLSEVLNDSKGNQFREVIRPGAFTSVLANNPDVRLLLNHEGLPLARTTSGTMRLFQDERGLRFEADLDPTDPDVQRLIPKMKRGDLNQCSFAFNLNKGDAHFRSEGGVMVRDIHNVSSLSDASLVTYPAYTATSAMLRSLDEDPDYAVWMEQQKEAAAPLPVKEFHGSTDVLRRRLDLMQR